jgi:hypothetical protein
MKVAQGLAGVKRSEAEIQRAIFGRWRARGGIVTRVQSGKVPVRGGWMQLADKGTPDSYVMGPLGASFWAETKTDTGQLSTEQIDWHYRARKLGHNVFVVRNEQAADAAWLEVVGE